MDGGVRGTVPRHGGTSLGTPSPIPAGYVPTGAPAPSIEVAHAAGHRENGVGAGVTAVPAPRWVELGTVDTDRIRGAEIARGIEGMDRHVEEERARHALPEASEPRTEIEVR